MTNIGGRSNLLVGAIPSSPKEIRKRRFGVRAMIGLASMVLLCGTAAGILAYQAANVQGQLEQALNMVPQLRVQLEDGDQQEAQRTVEQIREKTKSARSTATGPLWTAAAAVPFVGPNFRAVSEVTVSADDVVTLTVVPLLDTYASLDWRDLPMTEGRVDVSELRLIAPKVQSASDALSLSHARLAAIDLSRLVPQVAGPVRSATTQLQSISSVLGTASSAAQLIPSMLGVDGPRNYLVLVQNSAEARATGGIPGALAILNTDNGLIRLGQQSSAVELGAFLPPIGVDSEQETLYTSRLGTQMQNVNLTPDFPTAAATAKGMWEERHPDQTIDGVLSLDPVALGHLLSASGPVVLTDPDVLRLIRGTNLPESLTEENVVPTLLSDVYREIRDPAAQDIYFAAVAERVFSVLTDGRGKTSQLIRALSTSTQEARIYLWSSREDEQAKIVTTALGGSVEGPNSGGATFGVYFNDGTGAKMDYYARRTVQLVQSCESKGSSEYMVRLTASNEAPLDAASSLPAYVTGGGTYGVDPGRIRTNYVFYGPAQAFVESASIDGTPVPIGSGRHGQRPVGTVSLELSPGETAELDVLFSKVVQDTEPRLLVTPTVQSPAEVILPAQRQKCG